MEVVLARQHRLEGVRSCELPLLFAAYFSTYFFSELKSDGDNHSEVNDRILIR